MKRSLPVSILLLIGLAGCIEKDLPLAGGNNTSVNKDTTYVTTPEKPQVHNILLEEFTGANCPNCPPAHAVLAGLLSTYGTQLIPIAIHPNLPQGGPYSQKKDAYDFITAKGTDISTQIYGGIGGLPVAGIDRTLFTGQLQLTKDKWASAVAALTSVNNGINLYVASHYNAAAGVDTIAVTIAYTSAVSTPHDLNLAITQDSVYDWQDDLPTADSNYLFNAVFRDLVTSDPYGDAVLPSVTTKEAGRVVKLYYTYKTSTSILFDPKHCKVVAFITDASSGTIDVLQSAQTSFTGQ